MTESNYLTVREVAERMRVSDLTVRRWVWDGRLPAMRVGRILRIRAADVERLGRDSRNVERLQLRPGSAAALLAAAKRCARIVEPGDVEELERLIDEGSERPSQTGDPLA